MKPWVGKYYLTFITRTFALLSFYWNTTQRDILVSFVHPSKEIVYSNFLLLCINNLHEFTVSVLSDLYEHVLHHRHTASTVVPGETDSFRCCICPCLWSFIYRPIIDCPNDTESSECWSSFFDSISIQW